MLPDREQWKFDEITREEPDRASLLETCGTAVQLLEMLRKAVRGSLADGGVRFGHEVAEDARGGYRAVIQFHVGCALFDWFFNARSGYRAHYWSAPEEGLHFNDQVVACIRSELLSLLPDEVISCDIRQKFQVADRALVPKQFFARSLAPGLSKVWWCVNRLTPNCAIEQLPPGLIGPRLAVNRPREWAAPYRDEQEAWVDVYGAFEIGDRLYQPKNPRGRAEKLHIHGEA